MSKLNKIVQMMVVALATMIFGGGQERTTRAGTQAKSRPVRTPWGRTREQGFSTMQVIAGLAIGGVVTAGAAIVIAPAYNNVQLEGAYQEIALIMDATRRVKTFEGSYDNLGSAAPGQPRVPPTALGSSTDSIGYLKGNGYLESEQYTTGAIGENFLSGGILVWDTPAVYYGTDSEANCNALMARVNNTLPGATATCGAGNAVAGGFTTANGDDTGLAITLDG